MGGFHIVLKYLAVLGKKNDGSGSEDLLIESRVYGRGTVSAAMKGKSYNRGMCAHKITMEALFRLQWQAFNQYKNQHGGNATFDGQEVLQQRIEAC